jgi:hypothetical protein
MRTSCATFSGSAIGLGESHLLKEDHVSGRALEESQISAGHAAVHGVHSPQTFAPKRGILQQGRRWKPNRGTSDWSAAYRLVRSSPLSPMEARTAPTMKERKVRKHRARPNLRHLALSQAITR